ncbi:MAG TPA: Nif3-like dinuclear metal center hexameric protein [Homoserinimonas sp.]|nr:Nif3-like dinuclear metal center hexameric protein [Homoserinimonas sp.]
MPATVAEVNAVIERLWPLAGAEAWDAPGFLVGAPGATVDSVHLAVDAVADTIDEAIAQGADLLLVHHPLLLRGVTTVAEDRYKGAMVGKLIRANCALVAAHTNADVVEAGTSGVFAALLELVDVTPIAPSDDPAQGIGRVGRLPQQTTLGALARRLGELLPATASGIRVAGNYNQPVHRVALCGGAGDSLLNDPAVLGADVYITSDLRHHPASESRANSAIAGGPALIDVSHWASEWLWLETAAAQLRQALPDIAVTVSDLRTDPWDFAIVQ